MWGKLRIIQGGHLKIRGTGKNSNMGEHSKFLGGFEKSRGAGLSRGLSQRGVFTTFKREIFLLITGNIDGIALLRNNSCKARSLNVFGIFSTERIMAANEDKAAVNSLLSAVFLLITSQVRQQVEAQQVDSARLCQS